MTLVFFSYFIQLIPEIDFYVAQKSFTFIIFELWENQSNFNQSMVIKANLIKKCVSIWAHCLRQEEKRINRKIS